MNKETFEFEKYDVNRTHWILDIRYLDIHEENKNTLFFIQHLKGPHSKIEIDIRNEFKYFRPVCIKGIHKERTFFFNGILDIKIKKLSCFCDIWRSAGGDFWLFNIQIFSFIDSIFDPNHLKSALIEEFKLNLNYK